MDIYFHDPSEIPLPADEVRIRELKADLWPDGRRVHISVEVDPFQRRPSLDLIITNPQGEERASTSIVESMTRKMEVNMHLRGEVPAGEFKVQAILFYSEAGAAQEGSPEQASTPQTQHVVDRAETVFTIPG